MSLFLSFFKFFEDVIVLLKMFKETPIEKHEELRQRIDEAFQIAKSKEDPGFIADIINDK